MPERALLLVNRNSRSGDGPVESGIRRLRLRGIEIVEARPDRQHPIPELIRRHCHEVDCVIVGGGDGSINCAAPALLETGLPLGVLPMGTANDLARTLKIPTDLEQAADIIGTGLLQTVDLGCVNDHLFFNVANIGLGVHVAKNLSPELKRRWGIVSYARSLLATLKSFRPFGADIVCDGRRRRVRAIQIAVGNGRHYGGGMTIAAEARIEDGVFFLYSVAPLRLWEMIKLAPSFRSGNFEERDAVIVDRGSEIEINTRKPMAVSADGELITWTPAKFKVLRRAVKVFVPAAHFQDMEELSHAA